jgi:small subunit ribosomal protein S13
VEFRHIVRVAATELQGKMPLKLALTKIKGVGPTVANAIITALEMDPSKKMGDFTDEELEKLGSFLKDPKGIPEWALNRRKDPFTGGDHHLTSSDLTIQAKQDVDYMKKIKSYKGMRHAFGLKVRGQRTKSTGRTGRTMGVQRKRIKMQQAKKKEAKE